MNPEIRPKRFGSWFGLSVGSRRGRGLLAGCSVILLLSGATRASEAGPASSSAPQGICSLHNLEREFLTQNDAAMTRMMAGMSVKATGDVDHDFVDMMTPHHQGAIDMAVLVLRYGHNEQIRRLAQEIIVDQQQEIAAMKLAIGEAIPPPAPAPTMPPQNPPPYSHRPPHLRGMGMH